jgi:YVTN family beta-propeller protein
MTALGGAACALLLANAADAQTFKRKLYVAANATSDVYVIDAATNKIIKTIRTAKAPHGFASPPTGEVLWVSGEDQGIIDKVDTRTDEVVASFDLGEDAHESEITDDGKMLYVPMFLNACWLAFDTRSNRVVAKIPVPGGLPHNTKKGLNDQRYMYLSPMGGTQEFIDAYPRRNGAPYGDCDGNVVARQIPNHKVFKLDTTTNKIVGSLDVGNAPRPIAVNADGSRLYVDTDDYLGVIVVDTATMTQLARVDLPKVTPEQQTRHSHAHGIAVRPGNEEVWQTSVEANTIYVFRPTANSLEYVTQIAAGKGPNWLSFAPDGTRAYSSNTADDSISVFDTSTYKEVARIQLPKGALPKTNIVVDAPVK